MRIDWWTLALQTVNVLILVWILGRFFFRPVMDIVAKRQQEANRLLNDAARNRNEAASMRAEADKARANISAQREDLIAAAHAEAQSEKQHLLRQTSEEITKLRTQAKAAIARDRTAAETQIVVRAADLSIEIARRLLERFSHRAVLTAFLDQICAEVRSLPVEERDSFAATTTERQIEVVTAAPLSEDETQSVHAALEREFGADLPFSFRSDPGIIAGIEIHGPNTIIRNSWGADLDRIRQELAF